MDGKHEAETGESREQRAHRYGVAPESLSAPTAARGAKEELIHGVCSVCGRSDCFWATRANPLGRGCQLLISDPPAREADPPSPAEEFLADLVRWQAHARSVNSEHVSIPCSAMDRVIRILTPAPAISLPPISLEAREVARTGHEFDQQSPSQDCSCGWRARGDRSSTKTVRSAWLAHISSLRASDSLNVAVQTAARDLPEDYAISIVVERGSARVVVSGLEGFEHSPDGAGMTLSEQISECVAKAKEDASLSNHGDVQDAAAGER